MKQFILTLSILAVATFGLNAQINTPAASPSATLKQTVGMTDVEVNYSRPSARGRVIFAEDGLVPYGKLWRLGANRVTNFDFGGDVMVGGAELKKGKYAVIAKPHKDKWEFMFYTYDSGYWSDYKDKTAVATVSAETSVVASRMESFTIDFGNFKDDGATIMFAWDNVMVGLPISVNSDEMVMKQIEKAMAGTTAGEYYAAGSYYHKSGKDINQAYEWVHKANEMSPKFWQLRRESLILADMNRLGDAIMTAEKSLAMAKEAENNDYIRMNEKSIAEWTAKAKKKAMKSGAKEGKK